MRERLARLVAAALAVVAAAACGVQPTGVIGAGGPVETRGRAGTITVYLLWQGRVVPSVRPGLPDHPYLALSQLSIPVTSEERARGLYTEVHRPLQAWMVQAASEPQDMGSLTVDLSSAVPRRRVHWSRAALAQISCTAQAVPGIRDVLLWSGPGADKDGWGSAQCEDYRDLMR
ncbi:hypothetical protein [Actinomadura napierensis]